MERPHDGSRKTQATASSAGERHEVGDEGSAGPASIAAERLPREAILAGVARAREQGIDRDVRRLLRWAHELLGTRLMMSTAFGKSGMVILHILKDEAPEVPVFFLDTGFHFPETLDFLARLRKLWNTHLIVRRPKLFGADFTSKYGEKLYETDPDLCCHKNKVEPFRELIAPDSPYQGWITGIRRDQESTRAQAEPIELLEGNMLKIQPLAYWTRVDVEKYIDDNDIPLHPLFSQGYASIGCAPCTRPSGDSKNERAGRWAGTLKTECGLHTSWKKAGRGSGKQT